MITTERQYAVAHDKAARLHEALANIARDTADLDPLIAGAMRQGLEAQLEQVRSEMTDYEISKSGRRRTFVSLSLREVPANLIRARIALGITQRELARRIGVKEQQVQRYEATTYAGAGWKRLASIEKALGISSRTTMTLADAGGTPPLTAEEQTMFITATKGPYNVRSHFPEEIVRASRAIRSAAQPILAYQGARHLPSDVSEPKGWYSPMPAEVRRWHDEAELSGERALTPSLAAAVA